MKTLFTKPQAYTFLKYIVFSIVIILGTITFNIFSDVYNAIQDEKLTKELKTVNTVEYRDTVDGVDWYIYRNGYYGYEISYPEGVELTRSSTDDAYSNIPDNKKDPLVVLNIDDKYQAHTIGAGANTNFTANSQDELYKFYDLIGINDLIKHARLTNHKLTRDDFVIKKITFQGREAVAITSPVAYRITTFNSEGKIFFVNALKYNGSLETEKDRNTRAIMETFRVLD